MQVREIMSKDLVCCSPAASLVEAAQLMADHDCGEIPIVERGDSGIPIGVITDRDITCRGVAQGRNPYDATVRELMSSPVITVRHDASLEDCCRTMAQHQLRRVPVVDMAGSCVGVISQADIARKGPKTFTADLVQEVSRPTAAPSRVG
jgi:CBS domain-containing protein